MAQRSSSRATRRRPQNAASATANDLASARPPKYLRTFSTVSASSGKSLVSWSAAAARERRSWPTAETRKVAASLSMVAPWGRTSSVTNPGKSEARISSDLTSVTAASLRSLASTPDPLGPPPWTSTSATSSAGAAAYSSSPSTDSSGRFSSARDHDAAGAREQRRRRHLAELGQGQPGGLRLGDLGLRVVAADRVADGDDGALVEELLLAGHQGDPAQHVLGPGAAALVRSSRSACHRARQPRHASAARQATSRPSRTATTTSPSRSVRSTSVPAR